MFDKNYYQQTMLLPA